MKFEMEIVYLNNDIITTSTDDAPIPCIPGTPGM